jgi:hypothetical protein
MSMRSCSETPSSYQHPLAQARATQSRNACSTPGRAAVTAASSN